MTGRRVGEGWDPTRNGWAGIEDPANQIETCGSCGDDYAPGRPCSCPSWSQLWNPKSGIEEGAA